MSKSRRNISAERTSFQKPEIQISIMTKEQLKGLLSSGIIPERIYLAVELMEQGDCLELVRKLRMENDIEIYAALPYIMREEKGFDGSDSLRRIVERSYEKANNSASAGNSVSEIDSISESASALVGDSVSESASVSANDSVTDTAVWDGFLVRNLEELGVIKHFGKDVNVTTDYGMYIWNSFAAMEEADLGAESISLPYELNYHELEELFDATGKMRFNLCVYGRIPMMVSANCIFKTNGKCSNKAYTCLTKTEMLRDRKAHNMPVTAFCSSCYNIIWNYAPCSLHKQLRDICSKFEGCRLRIDFTVENEKQTKDVLEFWKESQANGISEEPPYSEYTTGHFRRGVE